MFKLLIGILVVAAVATAGDFIWFHFGVRHQMAVGVFHGAVLLMAVGGALGWPARNLKTGLVVGIVAGVGGALIYYALARSISGPTAMLMAWAAVWVLLGIGEGRIV